MKKILFFASLLFSFIVSAQQSEFFNAEKHLQKHNTGKKEMLIFKSTPSLLFKRNISPLPEISYTLSNGDKVFALPTDNMPCVKPDMSQFQAMPNPGKDFFTNFYRQKRKAGTMPNASPKINRY